jgi:hypothetical protein
MQGLHGEGRICEEDPGIETDHETQRGALKKQSPRNIIRFYILFFFLSFWLFGPF